MKVIVGMSGGVDSSVAAYVLKAEGYEVEGVSFILGDRRAGNNTSSGCCPPESILCAQKSARHMGIPHTVVDLEEEFSKHVIAPFINAYLSGLTPNPCVLCNSRIKFSHLNGIAEARGAAFIATGHYARISRNASFSMSRGDDSSRRTVLRPFLLKGIDTRKDQSYVLYVLTHNLLGRLILPLGGKIKDEVREIAREIGLTYPGRQESREICFVGGKDYVGFLEKAAKGVEGPIIEAETGKVLGRHRGIHSYTIGQRKGLGIAAGRPLYVVGIDPFEKAVFVGTKDAAKERGFLVREVNWLIPPSESGGARECSTFRATVKIRSTMKDESATLSFINGNEVYVLFDEPQWAPAPGQSAVFYDGEFVTGGGVIAVVNSHL
jgi:tRNA-specific 2-thiouridylase